MKTEILNNLWKITIPSRSWINNKWSSYKSIMISHKNGWYWIMLFKVWSRKDFIIRCRNKHIKPWFNNNSKKNKFRKLFSSKRSSPISKSGIDCLMKITKKFKRGLMIGISITLKLMKIWNIRLIISKETNREVKTLRIYLRWVRSLQSR